MRAYYIAAAAVALFGFGCNKSPEGGTPGTKASFQLSLPTLSQDVKKGETKMVDASITRGSDFKKDVKLKVDSKEKKVDVTLVEDTVKADKADGKFQIKVVVAKDAPVGDHEITVTGTPDGGSATTGSFKVNVKE